MRRLLSIEWTKIFYNKTTRNFTIIYFLILIVMGIIVATIRPNIGGYKVNLVQLGAFNFPVIWQNVAYVLAIAKIFLAVIIISNSTIEYEHSTLKQNLIDGLTKKEFLYSKTLSNSVLALISTFFVAIIAFVLGLLFSKSDTAFYHGMFYITNYMVKLTLFFTICSTLAIWLRKSSYAFLGLFVYWMIEGSLKVVDDFVINVSFKFSDYLPFAVSSNLVSAPKFNLNDFILGNNLFYIVPINWVNLVIALIYIVLFTLLSGWILKRRDL